jgi:hypothetical protein
LNGYCIKDADKHLILALAGWKQKMGREGRIVKINMDGNLNSAIILAEKKLCN